METVGFGYVKEGVLKLLSPAAWHVSLSRFGEVEVIVTIESHAKHRSNQQNRWYWGVIIPLIAEHEARKRERDIPYPRDAMHDLLKRVFLDAEETDLGTIAGSTRKLSTEEFFFYCETIRAHYAAEGLSIPDPGDQ